MKANSKKHLRVKFIFRTVVLLMTFGLAVYDFELLKTIIFYDISFFKTFHLIWLFLMVEMLRVFVPAFNKSISCGKGFAKHYRETSRAYDKKALQSYTKKYNRRAGWAGLLWLTLLLVIGGFYHAGAVNAIGIHMIVVLFYFGDEVCINIWCPFGAWIVRNKCCNTCRIYNWNYFMIFSPYVYVFSFWTYSLLGMALLIFLQWEYLHFKYPERFWEFSNVNLQCGSCWDMGLAVCCADLEEIKKIN